MNNALLLSKAFLAGALDLRRSEALLNRINVFPIVDADTGTNMCQTLSTTIELLRREPPKDLESLAFMARENLLGDAKGNSGVIFSQFLVAFFESLNEADSITLNSFLAAVSLGRDKAYNSVAYPVEGTLLTTMGDLVRALENFCEGDDFQKKTTLEQHSQIESQIAESVARTPELLPKLKRAGVVDSGALGFYLFASGLTLVLPALEDLEPALNKMEARIRGEDSAPLENIKDTILPSFLLSEKEEGKYRYCLNMLIEIPSDSTIDWSESFENIGASVDGARSGDLLKLHVHTDDPKAAEDAARKLGELKKVESDDMTGGLVQSFVSRGDLSKEKVPLRVVGDSSMSIALETEEDLGIYKLENYVNVHGKMVSGRDLNRDELFARMRKGHVYKTAQTSPAEARDFLGRILAVSEKIVFFAVGNAYSGTQSMVRKIVSENSYGDRVTILDSHAASGQQGLACIAAAKYAKQATDLDDLLSYSNRQLNSCMEYLVIDDLKHLARSGRIGKIKAAFAGALLVKPIVGHGMDGAITYAKVRSHRAALEEILKRVQNHPGEGRLLLMVEYTDNRDWTKEVVEKLRSVLQSDCEIVEAPLPPTSAVHMGPGTWGVAVTRI